MICDPNRHLYGKNVRNLFKVNNRYIRITSWRCFGVVTVNFEQTSHISHYFNC